MNQASAYGTAALLILAGGIGQTNAQSLSVSDLASETHIHGLAVDRHQPQYVLIATHHGLFRAGPDGTAERISVVQDFMGFNPHPSDPNTLYASGHPAEGGNLGFIVSADQGRSWQQVSPGANGPVDFHQMTVSPADPNTVYGAYDELQVSRDAGRNWVVVGPLPEGLIDLAGSASAVDTLYAATDGGLSVSSDAGKTWEPQIQGAPVTLVETFREAGSYAYIVGRGLVKAGENFENMQTLGNPPGVEYLLHLAVDPADPKRLFAVTGEGHIIRSADEGRTWNEFGRTNSP